MTQELIARIEAATGPDREIDNAIVDAFSWRNDFGVPVPPGFIGLPLYTSSIDHALKLVPDGHQWSLAECAMPGRYYAELGPRKASVWSFDAQAATPRLSPVRGGSESEVGMSQTPEQIAAGRRRSMPLWMCPHVEDHTPCPEGYLQWHAWAKEMAKTHKPRLCHGCDRYAVWEPKRAILKEQTP